MSAAKWQNIAGSKNFFRRPLLANQFDKTGKTGISAKSVIKMRSYEKYFLVFQH